jgi:Putative Flp pilus-assembly TadE/G-like
MPRLGRQRDESGQMLVIWTIALVGIVLFAALAIDLGNVGQVHQNAQNAADSAALSGAQLLVQGSSQANVVDSVETYVKNNYPQMQASPDWDSCGSPPSGYTGAAGASCISFKGYAVHVQIPGQLVHFWLGQVGNAASGIGVSASATATAESPGSPLIVPIAISASAAGGGLQCIKGGKGGANCLNNLAPGNQGALDSPRLRVFTGAAESGHGGNNEVLEFDMAVGIDHNLNIYNAGASNQYCDADAGTTGASLGKCNGPGTTQYDSTSSSYFDLGSQSWLLSGGTQETENGLVDGDTGVDATDNPPKGFTLQPRFAHPDGFSVTGTNSATADPPDNPSQPYLASNFGKNGTGIKYSGNLNGRFVSYYLENGANLPPLGQTVANTCFPGMDPKITALDVGWNPALSTDAWSTDDGCLSSYLSNPAHLGKPIFSSDIASSPRFGFVPVVQDSCNGSSTFCEILGFEAIYFDLVNIQGNDASVAAWVFDPSYIENGPAPPGSGGGPFSGSGLYQINLCSIAVHSGGC